jgi:hypothetical protein
MLMNGESVHIALLLRRLSLEADWRSLSSQQQQLHHTQARLQSERNQQQLASLQMLRQEQELEV